MSYSLHEDGFEMASSVLSHGEVEDLRSALSAMKVAPGHRHLMRQVPEIAALATSPRILGLLEEKIGMRPFPVRSIFFDKTPEANWLVPWHQDLTIAVQERMDLPDYGPWSVKEGVPHVQPPTAILETMVTVRLHLDDCGPTNGPLRVLRGSHRYGKLPPSHLAESRASMEEVVCCVACGDALIMRPLLLHASSEALVAAHRRVIHLEYATRELPGGLQWAEVQQKAQVTANKLEPPDY